MNPAETLQTSNLEAGHTSLLNQVQQLGNTALGVLQVTIQNVEVMRPGSLDTLAKMLKILRL
jgi:hypothetical protein